MTSTFLFLAHTNQWSGDEYVAVAILALAVQLLVDVDLGPARLRSVLVLFANVM